MRCQLGAGIVYLARAWAFVFRNPYSSPTMSRSTWSRRVTNGSSGGRPDVSAGSPEPVFQRPRQPDSASRNSNPLTGGSKSGSSTIGISAIQPLRRYSPSVIASIPAPSWSAIASSTARSSVARRPVGVERSRPGRLPRLTQVLGPQQAADDVRADGRHHARDYKVPIVRDVEGKVAFVTGGGSGVGLGMAKAFVAAGMRVAIADIRADHLEAAVAELDGDVHAIQLDVTDREAFARAADETERVLGNVHVLCNNAGINLFNDLAEATYQDWDWVLGVNLGGVVNGVVTFVPRIKAHGERGHVVNTASMAAFVAGPGAGIYTTAKFAVHGLSDALRWSLLPHGIGVSMVCPGLVKSKIYESDLIRPGGALHRRRRPPTRSSCASCRACTRPAWSRTRSARRSSVRSGRTTSTSSRTPTTGTSCGRSSTRSSPRSPTSRRPRTGSRSRRDGVRPRPAHSTPGPATDAGGRRQDRVRHRRRERHRTRHGDRVRREPG